METVGVLVVSYGSREAAIIDALSRSTNYNVEIFVADKQYNPFNATKANVLEVTGLDVQKILDFAKRFQNKIDFGWVGPENPIIGGVRDLVEKETDIKMICPTKEYAIEGSKVRQRQIMQKAAPECCPTFIVFDPADYKERTKDDLKGDVIDWIKGLGGVDHSVLKPDLPGFGKGVGVGGEHYFTEQQALEHFFSLYGDGAQKVLVEERVDGVEFSLQCLCDGKNLVPTRAVQDHKRAYDNDFGPNTGGMGSTMDKEDQLPFMTADDYRKGVMIAKRVFEELKGEQERNVGLLGVPFYWAFTCAKNGVIAFEDNSRWGDPEGINVLAVLEDDFVDVSYKILDGKLTNLRLAPKASVVTYAVPMTYGEYRKSYSGSTEVDLSKVHELQKKYGDDKMRIYPGSMELRDGKTYVLKSRGVAVVGIGDDIYEAREISLDGIRHIDGPLWNRWDIASREEMGKHIAKMKRLRD